MQAHNIGAVQKPCDCPTHSPLQGTKGLELALGGVFTFTSYAERGFSRTLESMIRVLWGLGGIIVAMPAGGPSAFGAEQKRCGGRTLAPTVTPRESQLSFKEWVELRKV